MKAQILTYALLLVAVIANAQNCFWAKKAGGSVETVGKSITTDASGNVYCTGIFSSSAITFGDTTLINTTGGGESFFVAKYSAGGDVLWARGGGGWCRGYGIATDSDDNVFVTGNYSGSVSFGTTTLNAVQGDVFIVKYDTNGNMIWAKSAGGDKWDVGYDISTDGSGNLYITGIFNSTSIIFGSTTLNNVNPNCTDFFIAKYNSDGDAVWARRAGGPGYEYGYGITTFEEKVFVTGSFSSDSVVFGGYTLHNDEPGGDVLFISCYDTSGSVIWANSADGLWGSVIGKGITADTSGNVFVCGGFSSVSVVIGNDSLIHSSSGGSSDIFIAKCNSDGNFAWAKGAGGQQGDYANGIAADLSGDVYITGYFNSSSINFDSHVLNNYSVSTQPDIFIAKYTADGNILWVQQAGGSGTDKSNSITKGPGDNVYFTGSFSSSPATFGNVTLTPVGNENMFVADMYNFSSGISSFTNATCFGAGNGTALTTALEGNLPYTYLWSTNPVQSTVSAINLPAGTFTVTITEAYGCAQISTVTITEPPLDSARICMVTSDSLSQYNIIVWDKTLFTYVDSFIVFREIATDNYQPIARISYDSLSQFTDTVRTLFFPNTGNPNDGTYRYKIQVHDTCGSYSDLSPYHNTIYFLNSNGTFYWTQPYSIENGSNPVTSYVLMRDDNSTGNWHPVSSVAGTQQVVSDPLYIIYQNTASWRVKTEWSISCTPTLKGKGNFSYSLSNIFTNNTTSVNKNNFERAITVYPNPTEGKVVIYSSGQNIQSMTVRNIIGETVYTVGKSDKQTAIEIDLSGFQQGVYFLCVRTSEGNVLKKLVKE